MKNRNNSFLLVLVVILVWGIIGYKVYKVKYPSNESFHIENSTTAFIPEEIIEAKQFTIKLNYRDPFLGNLEEKKQKNKSKYILNKSITFPKIYYKGMLSSKGKVSKTIFFVMINGKELFLSAGEQEEGVKLLKGSHKEIKVSFKNIKKTIPIQQ